MVVAFPWAGRDWNRAIAISGRAAMPGLPGGSGFDWRSVAGTTGLLRPRAALSGLGAMAHRRRGRSGLGQDVTVTTDASGNTTADYSGYLSAIGNPNPQTTVQTVNVQGGSASSSAPWYSGLLNSLVGVGSQITNYELNPLTNKSTYVQTPQGGIIATNNPNYTGTPLSTTASSMMPLLLLGGGLVLVMTMAKR